MLQPGDSAPALNLYRLDGKVQPLESLWASTPVVLAFFKAACPTCQMAFPFLDRLRGTDTHLIAVSQDSPAVTTAFSGRFGILLPFLLDSEDENYPVSNAFGIHHVPTLFVIGIGGTITEVIEGFDKGSFERLGVTFTPADRVPLFKPG